MSREIKRNQAWESPALATGGTLTVDNVTYHMVTNGSDGAISLSGGLGITPNSADPLYVRYDLERMVFAAANPLGSGALTGGAGTRVAGGTGGNTGDNQRWVVYQVTGLDADSTGVTLNPEVLGVLPDRAGSVKMRVYFELGDALAGSGDVFRTRALANALGVAGGVDVAVTPGTAVADVAGGFREFVGVGAARTRSTPVGRVAMGMATPAPRDATSGDVLAATDATRLFNDATITVKGDFSAGTYAHADGACTVEQGPHEPVPVTPTDNEVEIPYGEFYDSSGNSTDTAAPTGIALCFKPEDGKRIPAAPWMVTVKFAKATNARFGPPDVTAELGRFRRNGTIYRIPFLTTSPRFTQRLGIVNRGASAVAYHVGELHAQSGVTVAAGARASGALPPGQTVLTASDLVTITGGTRAAATVSIVADPSTIDASIDIIHPENGTVDTVHLTAE